MGDVHVVGNPAARRRDAAARLARVVELVGTAGHRPVVATPGTVDETRQWCAREIARGIERLVVVGGDGLVHWAVQAAAGTDTVVGIVPAGTGNDYADALGLPLRDVDGAVQAALSEPVPVDAVRAGDGWIASLATIGFSADVNERAEAMSWPRGGSRYTAATLLELRRLAPIPLVIVADGRRCEVEVTLLAVGTTSQFGGGMRICAGADPCDGRSDLTIVTPCGRVRLLASFPRVFRGTHADHPAVRMHRAATFEISTPDGTAVKVRADGEAFGSLPMTFTTVPGAVRIAGARPKEK